MRSLLALVVGIAAFIHHGAHAGNRADDVLPEFTPDEQAYQQRHWEGLIGCCIARSLVKGVFEDAAVTGDRKVAITEQMLSARCKRFKGLYKDQCDRVVPLMIKGLKGKSKVSKEQLESACYTGGGCKKKPKKSKKSKDGTNKELAPLEKGCENRVCTVHTTMAELVVEGDLTLRDATREAMSGPAGEYADVAIPPIIHFIFGMAPDFGGKPFELVHYLAVKSAHDVMPSATIFMYYKHEPSGEWWKKAKALSKPVRVSPVETVGGWKIGHVAHIADLLRLQALRDIGGIYMDLDVVTLRPFSPLMRQHQFVMGQEGENGVYGLCNAVLMSAKNSTFVNLWIDHYAEAYDPHIWSMHSVKLPSILGHLYPAHLTQVRDRVFFYPLWDKLDHMYAGHGDTFPDNIAMHLWESLAHDKYISRLTPEYILNVDNNFNNAVRRFLT